MVHCSYVLADCVPPRGSRRNGCEGSVRQHMCHGRGWQCQPAAVSPSSSSCRGTGVAHSCAGTPVGSGFLGPWATLLLNRGWLLVGSVATCAALPGRVSRPPFAHGLPHVSSRRAAAARLVRRLSFGKHPAHRPASPVSTSPAVPALPPAALPPR